MKLRAWIEFTGRKKIVFFILACVAIILICTQLPPEAWRLRRRQLVPFPVIMAATWATGWFVLLFVRAEDLHILAPFDFQAVARFLGGALIALGFFLIGFSYVAYG